MSFLPDQKRKKVYFSLAIIFLCYVALRLTILNFETTSQVVGIPGLGNRLLTSARAIVILWGAFVETISAQHDKEYPVGKQSFEL